LCLIVLSLLLTKRSKIDEGVEVLRVDRKRSAGRNAFASAFVLVYQ
jgi:hypothetical protein